MNGFMVSAANSGAGKTVITLALMRALKEMGLAVVPRKAGPDFIDPAFHKAATGEDSYNLDCWAMRDALIRNINFTDNSEQKFFVVEGMMGLYDGAINGKGSSAELARLLDLPVFFVVDVTSQSHSVAALVKGFAEFMPGLRFAGIILNKIGSPRHEAMLRAALQPLDVPVVGAVYRNTALTLPSRHLGLVQASERTDLFAFIGKAAEIIKESVDLEAMITLSTSNRVNVASATIDYIPPLGQRIAVSRDDAFRFSYPHLLDGWRKAGAEITFFSPLANEVPDKDCDSVYLCGGYPELFAGKLAAADKFKKAMGDMAKAGKTIYGECGGYMTLGETLEDSEGVKHPMLGLLPLNTSFKQKKLHLGYRRLVPEGELFGEKTLRGHEFHYASIVEEKVATPLFEAYDALDNFLGIRGMRINNVAGSFIHLIDIEG